MMFDVLALAAAMAGLTGFRCFQSARLKRWQRGWLEPPATRNPKAGQVAATWCGEFSYSPKVPAFIQRSNNTFTATLTEHDCLLAGEIDDNLGVAKVEGVVDYPTIRFKKVYCASKVKGVKFNADRCYFTKRGSYMHYEGSISPDGKEMGGEWFQRPHDRAFWSGTWKMTLIPLTKQEEEEEEAYAQTDSTAPALLDFSVKAEVPVHETIVCNACGADTAASYSFCLQCGQNH